MQVYAAIGDSDILPEIGELMFRIERILMVLQDETVPSCSRLHAVIQQAAVNLEEWAVTSFKLTCLIAQDELDSCEREQVVMLLRYMMQICERVEAAVFDHPRTAP
ncbi:hypothetical protein [Pantanalinema sp. GBBB05]|uniref:hypothetical protein n=1 Tax=Pantanalinema sp. GBBB05 TaxID=2604139 RepID=UPI001E0AD29F|nr:hypothetical protein [Pantanalinema sp. GBBB05]